MQNLFEIDEWKIIQNNFDPEKQEAAESIFAIGNGSFGQRANFEEQYSGESLQGSYVGGVYYPDKTRVGWWKNGYPEYFAKVLNSCNWIGIKVKCEGQEIDLAKVTVKSFYRELDMKRGVLERRFRVLLDNDREVEIHSTRFCSMDNEEIAAISYKITPINFSGNFRFKVYLDNNVTNQDSNYEEFFWTEDSRKVGVKKGVISAKTKKTEFLVSTAMRYSFWKSGDEEQLEIHPSFKDSELYVENTLEYRLEQGTEYTLKKYVSVASTINHSDFSTTNAAINNVTEAYLGGYDALYDAHLKAWENIWSSADIQIDGDASAQQAIRFNIFHLYQTYTGKNAKKANDMTKMLREKYGFYGKVKNKKQDIVSDLGLIQKAIEADKKAKHEAARANLKTASRGITSVTGGDGGGGMTARERGAAASRMGGGSRQAKSSGAQNTGRTDGGWGWAKGGIVELLR